MLIYNLLNIIITLNRRFILEKKTWRFLLNFTDSFPCRRPLDYFLFCLYCRSALDLQFFFVFQSSVFQLSRIRKVKYTPNTLCVCPKDRMEENRLTVHSLSVDSFTRRRLITSNFRNRRLWSLSEVSWCCAGRIRVDWTFVFL